MSGVLPARGERGFPGQDGPPGPAGPGYLSDTYVLPNISLGMPLTAFLKDFRDPETFPNTGPIHIFTLDVTLYVGQLTVYYELVDDVKMIRGYEVTWTPGEIKQFTTYTDPTVRPIVQRPTWTLESNPFKSAIQAILVANYQEDVPDKMDSLLNRTLLKGTVEMGTDLMLRTAMLLPVEVSFRDTFQTTVNMDPMQMYARTTYYWRIREMQLTAFAYSPLMRKGI